MLRAGVPVVLVVAGLVGPHNPVDTIGRAKFVLALSLQRGWLSLTGVVCALGIAWRSADSR